MDTLVLLPPLGHDKVFFKPLEELLTNRYHIVCLDYPEGLHQKNPLEQLTDFFTNWITENIESRIYLGGLSLGATLCFKIAERIPDKVIHIFAMATGGIPVARARKEAIDNAIKNYPLNIFVEKALSLKNFTDHFARNRAVAETYQAYLQERISRNDLQNIPYLISAAVQIDYQLQMRKFQHNTTVIWGDADQVFSMRHLEKIKSAMPEAIYFVLPHLGHFLPLESPEQVARIMLEHEISSL